MTYSARRRLLLVTYDFPPVTSAGMYRMVGMAKYLRQHNWEVTVLTVKDSFVYKSDWSMDLVPERLRVIRTRNFEFRRWRHAIEKRILGNVDCEIRSTNRQLEYRACRRASEMLLRLLRRIDKLLAFPDGKVGWFLPLFWKASLLLRTESYDAVLTSSPPHSIHLPFLVLRSFVDFEWITDFRDPWTIPRRNRGTSLSFLLKRHLERRVLRACNRVVANTDGNKNAILETLGVKFNNKVSVITNGFDTDLKREQPNREVKLACDLVYVGEIYPRMLDTFIEGIRVIRDQNTRAVPRLWIYGKTPRPTVSAQITKHNLGEYIQFKGRIKYVRMLSLIENANALLLLVPHGDGFETWVPSKLYGYLFARSPILVLGPRGDAANIVERCGRGIVVDDTSPDEVARKLTYFFEGLRTGTLEFESNLVEISKFRMCAVAKQMSQVLMGGQQP